MMKLQNKTALVTGAESKAGFGYAIARELAAEGAAVIATDLRAPEDTAADIRSSGGVCQALMLNVARPDSIEAAFCKAWELFDGIDILINNAGICPFMPFLELTRAVWDRTLAVNLTGVFDCSQTFAKRLIREGRRGKIVIISSFCVEYPSVNQTPYAASKGGVYMLAKNMALELAAHYINVNSVAPVGVRTNIEASGHLLLKELGLEKKAASAGADRLDQPVPSEQNRLLERGVIPYDIARAVVFFASQDADHITGQTLFVNGFDIIRP